MKTLIVTILLFIISTSVNATPTDKLVWHIDPYGQAKEVLRSEDYADKCAINSFRYKDGIMSSTINKVIHYGIHDSYYTSRYNINGVKCKIKTITKLLDSIPGFPGYIVVWETSLLNKDNEPIKLSKRLITAFIYKEPVMEHFNLSKSMILCVNKYKDNTCPYRSGVPSNTMITTVTSLANINNIDFNTDVWMWKPLDSR